MNKKILIIDDNIEICEMYQTIFKFENYDVKIENDGLKGIVTATEFKPDIIILDIMMPQTDGFEVLKSIKNHTNLKTKIIINSNLTEKKSELLALNLGAYQYLRKSDYTPIQVVNIIKKIFESDVFIFKIKKILIIDDSIEICEMYRLSLEYEGYEVKVENDGLKGITTALEYKPDLIILDIMMPQIDGYEVLKSIKNQTSLETKIIINSNLISIDDEKKALDLGATKYLRKSDYTPIEVIGIIKKMQEK